jgi:hypothetical protein
VIDLGPVVIMLQEWVATEGRPRRLLTHGNFESRVEEECLRAERSGGTFVLVRVHLCDAEIGVDAGSHSARRGLKTLTRVLTVPTTSPRIRMIVLIAQLIRTLAGRKGRQYEKDSLVGTVSSLNHRFLRPWSAGSHRAGILELVDTRQPRPDDQQRRLRWLTVRPKDWS